MTKRNADQEYLQHYGVKGMEWGVRRTPEQLAAARENQDSAGAGSNEEEDGLFESLGDAFEDLGEKLEDIGDDIKKKGMSVLTSIFGKSNPFTRPAVPNKKLTEQFKRDAKKGKPMPNFKTSQEMQSWIRKNGEKYVNNKVTSGKREETSFLKTARKNDKMPKTVKSSGELQAVLREYGPKKIKNQVTILPGPSTPRPKPKSKRKGINAGNR